MRSRQNLLRGWACVSVFCLAFFATAGLRPHRCFHWMWWSFLTLINDRSLSTPFVPYLLPNGFRTVGYKFDMKTKRNALGLRIKLDHNRQEHCGLLPMLASVSVLAGSARHHSCNSSCHWFDLAHGTALVSGNTVTWQEEVEADFDTHSLIFLSSSSKAQKWQSARPVHCSVGLVWSCTFTNGAWYNGWINSWGP